MRATTALLLLLLLAGPAAADTEAGAAAIEPRTIQASVETLASDAYEGRGSGADGGRRAGEWLAEQLEAIGVAPAGTEGYFQPFEAQGQRMRNVVATIPGREPDEQVVIGAHYDHLGLGHQEGSLDLLRGRGKIHNGADDNASGTAAILEIARAFKASGETPRRRIVFVWFDGEERGLLGSQHLLANPVFPAESTFLMINLDMVGRLKQGKLTVFGSNTGDRLPGWLEVANARVGLTLDLRETMQGNSDHSGWYERKVPVLVPFTGLHTDYHRPSDDTERLDVDGIAQVARLSYRVAAIAAEAQEPLVFAQARDGTGEAMLEQLQAMLGIEGADEKLKELRERFGLGEGSSLGELGERLQEMLGRRGGGGGKPRLGVTITDDGQPGSVVNTVTRGSPADRAGVQVGDRILALDGQPTNDLNELRARVGAAKGTVSLDVDRAGQRLTLQVELGGEPDAPRQPAPSPGTRPAKPAPQDGKRWF